MKYLVMLGDGMADRKIAELGNKTPLEAANKPFMDFIAKNGFNGTAKTVPDDMVPESDTANLAILGYDPKIYSKGRSPLDILFSASRTTSTSNSSQPKIDSSTNTCPTKEA